MLLFQTLLSFLVPSSSGWRCSPCPSSRRFRLRRRAPRAWLSRRTIRQWLGEPVQPDLRRGHGRAGDRAGFLRPLAALRWELLADPRGHRVGGAGVCVAGSNTPAGAARTGAPGMRRWRGTSRPEDARQLGLTACTALVVGNMIGRDLPAAGVARCLRSDLAGRLGADFARCAGAGGDLRPPVAARAEDGRSLCLYRSGLWRLRRLHHRLGLLDRTWTGNAGVAVAWPATSAFGPAVAARPLSSLAVALAAIWTLTLVNVRGVAEAGFFQMVTTVLKLVPLRADRHRRPFMDRSAQTTRRSTPAASPTFRLSAAAA